MALTITHWKSKPLFPGFKELVDWCHKINLFLFSIHLPNFTQCFTRATHEWMDLANHSNISGGRTWRHHFDHKSWEQTRQIWGIWKLRPAYSPETPNLGQIGDVLYRVTLKFDGWPWKTIGHLSFAVSSFVQHFIAIGEFKLELQSGNVQFGSNSMIFRAMWPWN